MIFLANKTFVNILVQHICIRRKIRIWENFVIGLCVLGLEECSHYTESFKIYYFTDIVIS